MEDDSLDFGDSPTAGATPSTNPILAQPHLQGDSNTPTDDASQGEQGIGEGLYIPRP